MMFLRWSQAGDSSAHVPEAAAADLLSHLVSSAHFWSDG